MCFEGAYHGITTASDEVTTTLNDNPRALATRPPWIHLAPMPNLYRGRYSNIGDDKKSLEQYIAAFRDTVSKAGKEAVIGPAGVAGFIAECLVGNAGGVEIPPGFMQVHTCTHIYRQ